MSYWNLGLKVDYSKSVEAAHVAVIGAKTKLREALQAAYPPRALVLVRHHRGEFYGRVAGWDAEGARVVVVNEKSGKSMKWWAAHVQLVDPMVPA